MPKEKSGPKELKVTDKRIFTPEGEIRDEFKTEIRPADPAAAKPAETPPPAQPAPKPAEKAPEPPPREERRRTLQDRAASPETPFANFVEPLIAQAYMSLGMLRNPYQPQAKIDVAAARQMIEIICRISGSWKVSSVPSIAIGEKLQL